MKKSKKKNEIVQSTRLKSRDREIEIQERLHALTKNSQKIIKDFKQKTMAHKKMGHQ